MLLLFKLLLAIESVAAQDGSGSEGYVTPMSGGSRPCAKFDICGECEGTRTQAPCPRVVLRGASSKMCKLTNSFALGSCPSKRDVTASDVVNGRFRYNVKRAVASDSCDGEVRILLDGRSIKHDSSSSSSSSSTDSDSSSSSSSGHGSESTKFKASSPST